MGNVFTRNDLCVVDDVLPRRLQSTVRSGPVKFTAAINARGIAVQDFPLEPVGDAPVVHARAPEWATVSVT